MALSSRAEHYDGAFKHKIFMWKSTASPCVQWNVNCILGSYLIISFRPFLERSEGGVLVKVESLHPLESSAVNNMISSFGNGIRAGNSSPVLCSSTFSRCRVTLALNFNYILTEMSHKSRFCLFLFTYMLPAWRRHLTTMNKYSSSVDLWDLKLMAWIALNFSLSSEKSSTFRCECFNYASVCCGHTLWGKDQQSRVLAPVEGEP